MDNGSGKKVAAIFASFIIGLIKGIIVVPRGCCRFYPSCSEYAHEALGRMPVFIALYKISYRLLRCNPFSKGGYDPVK